MAESNSLWGQSPPLDKLRSEIKTLIDTKSGQLNLKPQPLAVGQTQRADEQWAGVIDRVKRPLPALCVEVLAEVSLAVKQPDSNHGNTEVACRLHLVARHVAEPG